MIFTGKLVSNFGDFTGKLVSKMGVFEAFTGKYVSKFTGKYVSKMGFWPLFLAITGKLASGKNPVKSRVCGLLAKNPFIFLINCE